MLAIERAQLIKGFGEGLAEPHHNSVWALLMCLNKMKQIEVKNPQNELYPLCISLLQAAGLDDWWIHRFTEQLRGRRDAVEILHPRSKEMREAVKYFLGFCEWYEEKRVRERESAQSSS